MRVNSKNIIIQRFCTLYYPFAFFVLEDELQAMQLIVDIATGIGLKDKSLFSKLDQKQSTLEIFKTIVELGEKRSGLAFSDDRYLNLRNRAAVYLKDNNELSTEEISFITGLDRNELFQIIPVTRFQLIEMMRVRREDYAKI